VRRKINQPALKGGAADASHGIQRKADQNQPVQTAEKNRFEIFYIVAQLTDGPTNRNLMIIENLYANIGINKKGGRFPVRLLI
jgi:hypothetical protein